MNTQATRGREVVGKSWRIAFILFCCSVAAFGGHQPPRQSGRFTVKVRSPNQLAVPPMTQVTITSTLGFSVTQTLIASQVTFTGVPEGPLTVTLMSPGRDLVRVTTENPEILVLTLPAEAADRERLPEIDRAVVSVGRLQISPEAVRRVNRGIDAIEGGRPGVALQHLDEALALAPRFFEAHYNRGLVLAQMNQIPEARRSIEQALKLKPDDADARRQHGWILLQAERNAEAIDALRRSLALSPADAHSLTLLGIAYSRLGQDVLASQLYRQALEQKSDLSRAYMLLGHSQLALNHPREARRHFQDYLAKWPDGPFAAEARELVKKLAP